MANKKFKERTFVLGPSVNGVQSYSSGRQTIMGTGGVIESHDSYSHESNPGIEWAYKTFGKIYESCKEPAKRMRESEEKLPAGWKLEKDENVEGNYILTNEQLGYYDDVSSPAEAMDIAKNYKESNRKNSKRVRESISDKESRIKRTAIENGFAEFGDFIIEYDESTDEFTAMDREGDEISSGSFKDIFEMLCDLSSGDGDVDYWDDSDAFDADDMDDDFFDEDYSLDD